MCCTHVLIRKNVNGIYDTRPTPHFSKLHKVFELISSAFIRLSAVAQVLVRLRGTGGCLDMAQNDVTAPPRRNNMLIIFQNQLSCVPRPPAVTQAAIGPKP
ncbi:unnamed protein product, partial [Ectocarpus sp. 13 AM-2016]